MQFLVNQLDEAEYLTKENGLWVVAIITPKMAWTKHKQTFKFNKKNFILYPYNTTDGKHPTAAIALNASKHHLKLEEARCEIMQLCSALSWTEGFGLSVLSWNSGDAPLTTYINNSEIFREFIDSEFLPSPSDMKAKCALALFREGISISNPFYSFLSLYKSISVLVPSGKNRGNWIKSALCQLDRHDAKKRHQQLLDKQIDVSTYLFQECRNAVAHAEQIPYANPDELEDHFRLSLDIALIRNLAELAIEEFTDIKRVNTLLNERHYEIDGFLRLIPEETMMILKGQQHEKHNIQIALPDRYHLIARKDHLSYMFVCELCKPIHFEINALSLHFKTLDSMVLIKTTLSLSDNRLIFNPYSDIQIKRSDKQSIEEANRKAQLSVNCILINGHIEIWDAENDIILGRTTPFMPINAYVSLTKKNQ